ncbi:MAG: hypothetical protein HQL92_02095 [Magnetococcales bacterium]|nr:hypothetical protein [Magnetococcales bacterium]
MDMTAFSDTHTSLEVLTRSEPAPPATLTHPDLATLLYDLGLWLFQTMPVEAVAYWNPRLRKSHLHILTTSTERPTLEAAVHRLMQGTVPRIRHWRQQQWYFHLWMGTPLDGWDRLLIVEKSGQLSSDECNLLIQEAARTLRHGLRHISHPD